jgi:hypothetical protein
MGRNGQEAINLVKAWWYAFLFYYVPLVQVGLSDQRLGAFTHGMGLLNKVKHVAAGSNVQDASGR